MDTRRKIVERERGTELAERLRRAGTALRVVVGRFDPLLAAHAARLEEIAGHGGALLAVVTTGEQPILPAPARAELVAGLAAVDYVVIVDGAADDWLSGLGACEIVSEEAADAQRTRDLIRHVHSREPVPCVRRNVKGC